MPQIRRLFLEHRLLAVDGREALKQPGLDPWDLRAAALDRALIPVELAVALGHIARHRGFRSNSKRDRGANAADDASRMLNAIDAMRERLGQWRTAGEMFARDPTFAERKHNRNGDFSRSVLRADLVSETQAIFASQRRFGNARAGEALEGECARLASTQRPLQNSEHLVEGCPFERDQMRAARRAPGYEMFRLLARLAQLKLVAGVHEQVLAAEQIGQVVEDFGRQKTITC